MYALGQGITKDVVYAHMWGSLAASNGSKYGRKVRDLAAQNMSAAIISASENLAQECLRKQYKSC